MKRAFQFTAAVMLMFSMTGCCLFGGYGAGYPFGGGCGPGGCGAAPGAFPQAAVPGIAPTTAFAPGFAPTTAFAPVYPTTTAGLQTIPVY